VKSLKMTVVKEIPYRERAILTDDVILGRFARNVKCMKTNKKFVFMHLTFYRFML
jgi:hypothetical protein